MENEQGVQVMDWESEHLQPAIIVIFGITGDLAKRKLLPSLYELVKNDLLPPGTKILGVSRRDVKAEEVIENTKLCILENEKTCDPAVIKKLEAMLSMRHMDLTSPDHYRDLRDYLNEIEAETCLNRLFYLSIPPQVLTPIVKNLGEQGLNKSCHHGKAKSRILFEKPFGFDYHSGEELIETTGKYFSEEQIFRIDHYVAKETVQNLLTFRFRNPIFEDIWNAEHISKVEIIASESIDIERRADFYEQTGALRDLIQSHLMQLTATIAMDKPADMESKNVHAAKLKLLESIRPVPADHVDEHAIRGQYEGYKWEVSKPDSFVETFAALRLSVDNDRWHGVPFIVKTGKALSEKATKICVHFKPVERDTHHLNILTFYIQPNESISIDLWVKRPGFERKLQQAKMAFSYQQTFDEHGHPDAYERVLVDAVKGDHTLFATSEEIMASWRVLEPVLQHWQATNEGLQPYAKGSDGPALPENWD